MADPRYKNVTADEITDAYRRGYQTKAEYNHRLHQKAESVLEEQVNKAGFFGLPQLMIERTIEHVQENWEELKRIATTTDPTQSSSQNLLNIGKAMWAQIQLISAPMTALGEISGQVAENIALRAGASPGLAKVINIAVDVGSGFAVPTGLVSRQFAKGVQAVSKSRKAAAIAKATAESEKVAAKAAEEISQAAIKQGLVTDGVKLVDAETPEVIGEILRKGKQHLREAAGEVEDFPTAYKRYLREFKEITERKSHAETAAAAEKLGLGMDDLKNLTRGQVLNENQMYAFLKALEPSADNLLVMAKEGITDEASASRFATKLMEFFDPSLTFRASEVTAGRSVEILKEVPPMKRITDMLAAWDPENMAKGDFTAAMQTLAEDIAVLADEPQKMQQLAINAHGLWSQFRNKAWPMIREAYTNLLLARPATQIKNTLGNILSAGNATIEKTIGGLLSIDEIKGVKSNEGLLLLRGVREAFGEGVSAFGKAFSQVTPDEASKLDFIPHRIPGTLGRLINAPGDTLRGMDNFFKTVLTRGSYYGSAQRKGIELGYEGERLASYIANRVNYPTQAMMDEAKSFVLEQTFQNDLGTIGKWVQKGLQAGPLALWFPFMKTPINLAKYAWNRTPGLQMISGSLYRDIAAGGPGADLAIARLTMGNLMGVFLFSLAQEGLITGGGPTDPKLRRAWLETNQPYSFKTSAGWRSYLGGEPIGTGVSLVADFAEVMNQLDEPTAEQGAAAVFLALTRDITDKTYFQTVGDIQEALQSARGGEPPTKQVAETLRSPLTAVATGGPLPQAIARAIDPVRRDARNYIDNLRSRIPGFSKDVSPQFDSFGEPILIPQALGGPWVGAFLTSTLGQLKPEQQDPIRKEATRLQIKLAPVPWQLGAGDLPDDWKLSEALPGDPVPVQLNDQEHIAYADSLKRIIYHPEFGLGVLMGNDQYKSAPWAAQRQMFSLGIRNARKAASDITISTNPGLGAKVIRSNAEAARPMLTPPQQVQLEQQTQQGINLLNNMSDETRRNLLKWGLLGEPETGG